MHKPLPERNEKVHLCATSTQNALPDSLKLSSCTKGLQKEELRDRESPIHELEEDISTHYSDQFSVDSMLEIGYHAPAKIA